MPSENRKRLEALPIFLQPKLRLFLSVDLVGSTASKQRPNFPIREPGRLWADGGMAPPWLSPIANFFGSFQEAFVREWKIFKSQIGPKLGLDVTIDPSFWKANGDELIFVKELNDRKEILGCIDAWLKALKSVRSQLSASGLDVKATAWTAGFPVTNSELIFQVHPGIQTTLFEDDPRLQQFALLESWHKDPTSQNGMVMDFIGPSIDTGFRLASRSSPRHFVISIDIAYFLATAHLPASGVIDVPPIFYQGKIELKGVLSGKPYPIFWIDTMAGHKFAETEDRLMGNTPAHADNIKFFCLEFYKDNSTLMFLPFIFREDESQYGEFPENYIEALEHLCSKWNDEKTRYLKETEVESGASDESEKLSDAESEKKEEDILSALAEVRSSKSSVVPDEGRQN
jgi:hypothetical protein